MTGDPRRDTAAQAIERWFAYSLHLDAHSMIRRKHAEHLAGAILAALDAAGQTARPESAAKVRAQVPDEYLRLLTRWAADIAEYKASIGEHATSDKALWMRAVLDPDYEDGTHG